MVKIVVNRVNDNSKLCDYIKKISPNLTITSIKKDINKGQVKVNSLKVMDNFLLRTGDIITIFINIKSNNDNFLKCKLNIKIFYEDDNVIIFDKPKNVLCQEDVKEKINTLNNYIKKYCYMNKTWDGYDSESEPALVHRIDQNTMGLVIGAKNKKIARILNQAILNNEISKKYLTVIYNGPKKSSGLLVDYIYKDDKQLNKMIVSKTKVEFATQIKTRYKILYTHSPYTILEVELLTGKKHQIRAHLAFYKMYIVGDGKYGAKNKNLKLNSQLLISNKINFHLTNKTLEYLNNISFNKTKDILTILNFIE